LLKAAGFGQALPGVGIERPNDLRINVVADIGFALEGDHCP
jgi:hypothetical protein